MKLRIALAAAIYIMIFPTGAGSRPRQAALTASCAVLQEALDVYAHLKVGTSRKEVEKHFQRDGGAQFPSATRYTYPKCAYLHVVVNFDAKGTGDHLFSPEDKATEISRLYVDYSLKD